MSARIIDISPLVSQRIGVWPGDQPYQRHVNLSFATGDAFDLSAIHTTLHVGAHADAPSHCTPAGTGIDACALETYYGACQVLQVSVPRGERLRPADLRAEIAAPRLLFKTGSFPDPERFETDFNGLSAELVEFVSERGVRLVGIDTPSVDLYADSDFESHRAACRCGVGILEGIVLAAVPPGLYTLLALPLRLEGADASPVRAVLIAGDSKPGARARGRSSRPGDVARRP